MNALIRQRALELGFDDCRCTNAIPPLTAEHFQSWLTGKNHGEMAYLERNAFKRVDPNQVLPSIKSVISLAVSYTQKPSENLSSSPSGVVARYARFNDYHDVIGEKLGTLAKMVNELGGVSTRSLWYVDTGPILEREFAQRSGIGFVGKHTNLISRRLGNWIFLAEILTTLELATDLPGKNRCGSCTRCLTACPTHAITAPFRLDARRCISYLTIELKGSIPIEFRPAIGNRIYGCDDCLAACPWNRFAQAGRMMQEHARPDLNEPDLIELLSLTEEGLKKRFAGTPMLRTKRRGVLRNVCVALGNIGDTTALPALTKAAQDSEPLIAEHAHWAIAQIENRFANQ